jgi:hypothetical protein
VLGPREFHRVERAVLVEGREDRQSGLVVGRGPSDRFVRPGERLDASVALQQLTRLLAGHPEAEVVDAVGRPDLDHLVRHAAVRSDGEQSTASLVVVGALVGRPGRALAWRYGHSSDM